MIDDCRVHEHPAIGEQAVEIARQRTQIPEGVFIFILGDPFLNPRGKGVAVGLVK
jgi:hypothetical protein